MSKPDQDPPRERYAFPTFPILTTERLILREVVAEDAADLLIFRGDPEVQRYDEDAELITDSAAATRLVEEMAAWYRSGEAISWGVTRRGEGRVIGLFALYFWERRYYAGSIGYDLAKAYWRQGIATEAGRAVVAFGINTLHLHRINADARMENTASIRLLTRLGFKHEGVRRECVLDPDGSWQNWGIFGILESEYLVQFRDGP
jgi:[ribosomal protein S5]-alanine N-acetyltransferase